MAKYKNKYRIESTRLKNWNYRTKGAYFITIVTKNRIPYFGRINFGEMYLTEIGKLAHDFWNEIPKHFPHVSLGAFMIMPDHMHGIIIIENDIIADADDADDADDAVQTLQCNVSSVMANISPKRGSISTIIRSYKSITSKHARKLNSNFGWQSLFHDRIIRNAPEFNRIEKYIIENPLKWELNKTQK